MSEILTAAQMRSVEAAAIASGQVTGLELMERAGRGVVEAIFAEWPTLRAGSCRAVVLCGPGNNGGDGFVVARLLKEWGWEVEVFLYGTPEGMPPDARVNYERWVGMGGALSDLAEFSSQFRRTYTKTEFSAPGFRFPAFPTPKTDLFVDALFGTGLQRPVSTEIFLTLGDCWWNVVPTGKRVCIDVPSGICADSGRFLTEGYSPGRAEPYPRRPFDLCVTFHLKKLAHVLGDGAIAAGKVVVVDIGLPPPPIDYYRENRKGEVTRTEILKPDFTFPLSMGKTESRTLSKDVSILGKYEKGAAGLHKFGFGHAFVLSGPSGRGGAARLAARSALRAGAGLVTLACPTDAILENAARLDAVMLRDIAGPEALAEYLAKTQINAICLGPGLGLDRARELVPVVLAGSHNLLGPDANKNFGRHNLPAAARPGQVLQLSEHDRLGRGVVLDADALSAYADDPDTLFDMLHERCVLTPHHGEFARLFPDLSAKLADPPAKGPAYSKLDATCEASFRAGCTVLYKGLDTVISCGRFHSVHSATQDRAAPWLATAGSGDVLAGIVTGLLARGFHPQNAAETAVWLHVECARSFGPGLIAEDLPEELPKVFRALGV